MPQAQRRRGRSEEGAGGPAQQSHHQHQEGELGNGLGNIVYPFMFWVGKRGDM